MAKPPADTDPEKFIIGRGAYSNLQLVMPEFENGVFRFAPRADSDFRDSNNQCGICRVFPWFSLPGKIFHAR